MVIQLKSQPRVIPVNINGTIMVKLALEIHDVTIQACSQGTAFESAKNQSFYCFLNFVNHLPFSALSTPCPADKQFCVTERQVEWIGRGNQIHTSKRYCSNREYTPTGDNTGQKLHRYLTDPLKLSTEKINISHFEINLEIVLSLVSGVCQQASSSNVVYKDCFASCNGKEAGNANCNDNNDVVKMFEDDKV